jgi:hypothetical protein
MARDASATVAAAATPSNVLMITGEGSDECRVIEVVCGSKCAVEVLCTHDDIKGRLPKISRAPENELEIRLWDLACHGSNTPPLSDDPTEIDHTSAALMSSPEKTSLRSWRMYDAIRGNLVCIVSLSHAWGTAG